MNHLDHYKQEFKIHFMLYLTRGLANSASNPIKGLYFEEAFRERVSSLTLSDLQELAEFLPDDAIQASINSKDLLRSLMRLDDANAERETIKKLIMAGASNPAMNALYGLSTHEVADTRRRLNVAVANGRPGVLDDEQQDKVAELWNSLSSKSAGEKLLFIYQHTKVDMNVLWPIIEKLI